MRRRDVILGAAGLSLAGAARAETPLDAEPDHRRMLDLLGIDRLRPGADGWNTDAPNAANYDEAKARLVAPLPPLLRMQDGRPVDAALWPERRAELVELFEREVYGRAPTSLPTVRWATSAPEPVRLGETDARLIRLRGAYKFSEAIEAEVTLPDDAAGPVPVVVALAFPRSLTDRFPPEPGPSWRQQVIERGWAAVEYFPVSVQADDGGGLQQGIIGAANGGRPRGLDDWGALRAWAWGAAQVREHLATWPQVDGDRAAVFGLSRYGKAALVAMAFDERWKAGFIASSGAAGAKLMRRDYGERLENIASSGEYHWMGGQYLKYAGPKTVADLPVDAHQLIALCSPRPVFISCGTFQADNWTDPRGMFQAAVAAGPAYSLLGAQPLLAETYPPSQTLVDGDIAFRQHEGGHTGGPNWPFFLDWAASRL
jgi:hypothetical protein